ncbi:MAG: acetyl-CoA carboxylase biotin carboxylase subunit [Elusimicrobia bacterium]|nr:acetyl-CoA carboxylase biotin carboxylase subunit [Elusimicrobiota bacterium]
MKKLLVANRGEIAVRIIRSARELGIRCVAVHSDIDRKCRHVLAADEAIEIGEAPPLKSYLDMDRIISAARASGCDAVHPGYGFLSENGKFASRVADAGLVFVGPKAETIALMGDKVASKEVMRKAGVPVVPFLSGTGEVCLKEAEKLGYPLIIKAAAGGGGKGMRLVTGPEQMQSALEAAGREALKAFGDGRVFVEKYIVNPRHIEFQILADAHGGLVHLFERECSIQRRHQKVVEETPSPALKSATRAVMADAAVKAAKAVGYVNAGTVEFIFEEPDKFYFLEMNTRLQVEHPVTEMTTGIDLVREQLRLAGGEKLGFAQADLIRRGHSIECRVYAENPENNFLPSAGKIHLYREPSGPNIRNDSGFGSADEISTYYDPLISKLVTCGATREEARLRMLSALREYVALGVNTNIAFLIDIIAHPEFAAGRTCTDFIFRFFEDWKPKRERMEIALACVEYCRAHGSPPGGGLTAAKEQSYNPWKELGPFEIGTDAGVKI